MKKALRIGYNRYYCDENFNEHIEFIRKNAQSIDEVTLFPEFCHYGYWDKDFILKSTQILKDRIKKYREAGIKSVGINVLCTRGHTIDGWEVLPTADFQYEVLLNGEVSKSCLCITDEDFLEYIKYKYSMMASTGADFIWSDDDMRLSNCTCESCIKKFNNSFGYSLTRDAFVKTVREDKKLSSDWHSFLMKNLERLFKTIEQAIKGENPKTKIGYMTFHGIEDPTLAKASGAVKGRPGGGFYDERTPLAVFDKCLGVQYQLRSYPEKIEDIQYEYEAFNYQSLDRSTCFSELESTLSLMSGCNGVLYNNDIFYDRQSLLDMLSISKKKWEALVKKNKNLKNGGVYCEGRGIARALCEVGIPITFDLENASACFVLGEAWNHIDDETAVKILEKGTMTDGKGLEILQKRNLSETLGGKIKNEYKSSVAERFGEHPLSGKYENHYRDAFMNFSYYINNSGSAYDFEIKESAQIVSNLETITHEKKGCSLFINESSSRFACDGYFFLNSIKTYAKKEQIGNVLDWISKETLPLRIKETIKIMPTVKSDKDGNMTIMLVNASFDKTGEFECEIRSDKEFFLIGKNGENISLKQRKKDGRSVVTLPDINGWDYVLLTNIK